MEIDEIKKALLADKDFIEQIYIFIKNRNKEEFTKSIKKLLVDRATNDDSN